MIKSVSLFKISSLFSLALLVILAGSYNLSAVWPASSFWTTLIIICLHIAIPLWVIDRFALSPLDFNLYAYNLESLLDRLLPTQRPVPDPDYAGIKKELSQSMAFLVIILFFYIICYYFFYEFKASSNNLRLEFSLRFPPFWASFLLTQIFAVALPEEFFYRGFLQSSLQHKFSPGLAIIITNIIFAIGHFVGNLEPTRLLTFFPGLIFSILVYRYKSLLSAILFHAFFNLVGQILALSLV